MIISVILLCLLIGAVIGVGGRDLWIHERERREYLRYLRETELQQQYEKTRRIMAALHFVPVYAPIKTLDDGSQHTEGWN